MKTAQSGAGAAALAIQPPTQRPEGSREDDSRCKKDPKDKCDSCGGGTPLGLCASGDKVGCEFQTSVLDIDMVLTSKRPLRRSRVSERRTSTVFSY